MTPGKKTIHITDVLNHILRGNHERDNFGDHKDCFRFYASDETFVHFSRKIHAYSVMTNHIHLRNPGAAMWPAKIIENVAQRYTQWFNWRHHKVGHLFQGRYKAIMVDTDDYLLELAAYIHLNPVRSHLVNIRRNAGAATGLSVEETLGGCRNNSILSNLWFLKTRYLLPQFVNKRIEQGHIKEFHGEKTPDSRIFGDDTFMTEVLHEAEQEPLKKPDLDAVIAAIEKIYGADGINLLRAHSSDRLSCEIRALAAWATLETSQSTLTDLAGLCGRDVATLSYAARRALVLEMKDPTVMDKMRQLREELKNSPRTERSHIQLETFEA